MHKCASDKIKCFDCNSVICPECMEVSVDSLRCKDCNSKLATSRKSGGTKEPAQNFSAPHGSNVLQFGKKSKGQKGGAALLQVGAAAILYSFITMKLLNFISGC